MDFHELKDRLLSGNKRFSDGACCNPGRDIARRTELLAHQNPFAAVLTCADSRLPPEIIFDQGLGDLFVVRNAGNIVDDSVVASLEYAVEHLDVSLIVVLGHTCCGALRAACSRQTIDGALGDLIEHIRKRMPPGIDNPDIIAGGNADFAAEDLQRSPALGRAVADGKLCIAPALYNLGTGRVEFLNAS